ncbi:hypothetical protein K2173_013254 [Erythroxylum novogranatense]|uniref:Uncharacterized protein n=1 Tax=Erythroxylum novogranatense TaxID=1862640 RepID=A0AAV8TVT5_9ROSI|nr:hypothetical protein K2173_013254 [Erythroxylum novogranatense]
MCGGPITVLHQTITWKFPYLQAYKFLLVSLIWGLLVPNRALIISSLSAVHVKLYAIWNLRQFGAKGITQTRVD